MFELSIFLRERLVGRSTFAHDEVRIGRSADNEVRIDDPALSRYHASIEAVAGGHQLKDLCSDAGTLLNGQRASGRRGLNDGDRIQVGKFTLVFRTEQRGPAAHAETGEAAPAPAPGLERDCPWVGYLEAAGDGSLPTPRHVIARDFFLVGTSPQAQLVIERASGCAERAALVVRSWRGLALVALGPGVTRNRAPVDLVTPLEAGDELTFGTARFGFHAGRPDA